MSSSTHDLSAIFDEHVAHEFVAKDVAATMATMTAEPFVNHLPTMMGGVGADEVGLPVGTDGLLDKALPPVSGVAQARKVLDKDLPANTLLHADQPGPPA
jgi:hypothetical protein